MIRLNHSELINRKSSKKYKRKRKCVVVFSVNTKHKGLDGGGVGWDLVFTIH